MKPTQCPVGLCDEDSACRYCDHGGRARMSGEHAKDNWCLYVDARREACALVHRNVVLVIELDKVRDELAVLRRSLAPEHLTHQIALLNYENAELRRTIEHLRTTADRRDIATALYSGEG